MMSAISYDRRPALRTDLLGRAGIVLLANVCAFAGVHGAISVLVSTAAVIGTVERVVRLYRSRALDALLVGCGAVLLALLAAGLVLDLRDVGITGTGWRLLLTILALTLLAWCSRFPAPGSLGLRSALTTRSWWFVGAAGLLAAALALSARVSLHSDLPPVSLAVNQVGTSGHYDVVVESSAAAGPFDLVAEQDGVDRLLQTSFRVGPKSPRRYTIDVPTGARVVLALRGPAQATPLRTITLDRTVAP